MRITLLVLFTRVTEKSLANSLNRIGVAPAPYGGQMEEILKTLPKIRQKYTKMESKRIFEKKIIFLL